MLRRDAIALVLGLHTGWVGTAFFDDTRTALRLIFGALLAGMFVFLAFLLVVTALRRFVSADILPDPLDSPEEATPVAPGGGPVGTRPDRRDVNGDAVSRRRAVRGALAWSA